MSYHHNNGNGAVVCDRCGATIDEPCSQFFFEAIWEPSRAVRGGEDLCWRCCKREGLPPFDGPKEREEG